MQSQPASSSENALRLGVEVGRLPWIRRLAADYTRDYARLAPFFAGHPAEPSAWAAVIDATTTHARDRDAIVRVLHAQQARRAAPPEAAAAAAALADLRTVAVVTGQQAGIFGGPLFTLLKAVTTLLVAAQIEREHGIRAVPIFWIDAEDHDWEEVRATAVLDGDFAVRQIEADAPDGAGAQTIGSLSWGPGIADSIAALAAALPSTEFTPWIRDVVERAYAPGIGVAESFGRLLEHVLGPHGLVVFDASDPAAKPLLAGLFAEELEQTGRTSLLAARAGAELVARGYHMQVTPHADHAALFDLEAGRRPIRRAGDQFIVDNEPPVARLVLLERARRRPATFSPNVLLRPIAQDTLFPTACYVAGPNELAYLGQLKGVYESFGVPMPIVVPRASATLVDAAGLRFLTRHGIAFETLQARDEHVLNGLLEALLPPEVERALAGAEAAVSEGMEAVIAAMPLVDPTLEGRARSALGRMQHELGGLRAKVLQASKRRDETLRRQFSHVQRQAFPDGHPQERTVGGVSFLNRYGPALVTRLLDELPIDGAQHWVVTI